MPVVQVPGVGNVQFPDGMSPDDMTKALASMPQPAQPSLQERGQQALDSERQRIVSGIQQTGTNFSGLDPDKSLYQNIRSAGPKAALLGLQMIPAFRAMSAIYRIGASAIAGGGMEKLGQVVDAATGNPVPDNPGAAVAGAAIGGGATEAIPAAIGAVAQKILRPNQQIVNKAYDAVNAKVGNATINPEPLRLQAQEILDYYKRVGEKLPGSVGVPSGVSGALNDAALGNPLTMEESGALKDALQEIRNKPGKEGQIAQRLLGKLEEARVSLASAVGAGPDYQMAKTLAQAKNAWDKGTMDQILELAKPRVMKALQIVSGDSRAADEATQGVVQRFMLNPKYSDQVESLITALNRKESSKAGPILSRMVLNSLSEKMDQTTPAPTQPPSQGGGF